MTDSGLRPIAQNCLFLDLTGPSPRPMAAPAVPVALCLGNFDGVHAAHRALIQATLRTRQTNPLLKLAGAFCFFSPSTNEGKNGCSEGILLTSLEEKLCLFAKAGLDFVCLGSFPQMRRLPAQDFLTLLSELHVASVVCGYNYRFGAGAQGNAEQLAAYFASRLGARIIPEYRVDGCTVSSSCIRRYLKCGQPEQAAAMLGRPYTLRGRVIHGKQLGRVLGFPTANQRFPAPRLVPAHGVYAVRCTTPMGIFPGVANVGLRPTVEHDQTANCETYVMGLDANLYGQVIETAFLHFLRPEQTFDSVQALKQAIGEDVRQALARIGTGPRSS